jgi:hypothetical protein
LTQEQSGVEAEALMCCVLDQKLID